MMYTHWISKNSIVCWTECVRFMCVVFLPAENSQKAYKHKWRSAARRRWFDTCTELWQEEPGKRHRLFRCFWCVLHSYFSQTAAEFIGKLKRFACLVHTKIQMTAFMLIQMICIKSSVVKTAIKAWVLGQSRMACQKTVVNFNLSISGGKKMSCGCVMFYFEPLSGLFIRCLNISAPLRN